MQVFGTAAYQGGTDIHEPNSSRHIGVTDSCSVTTWESRLTVPPTCDCHKVIANNIDPAQVSAQLQQHIHYIEHGLKLPSLLQRVGTRHINRDCSYFWCIITDLLKLCVLQDTPDGFLTSDLRPFQFHTVQQLSISKQLATLE